jgi:hypothetical protein
VSEGCDPHYAWRECAWHICIAGDGTLSVCRRDAPLSECFPVWGHDDAEECWALIACVAEPVWCRERNAPVPHPRCPGRPWYLLRSPNHTTIGDAERLTARFAGLALHR